ncbi:hypothetical protein [Pseudonocardia sp. GCM10023141]|uniref:hypothetical protein n=1 Tax=Pseudonocardia sp. GCM10023141 TaxID=3252653 RepID=UPI00361D6DC3
MTDPRHADEQLHRAAETLRRAVAGRARGPWRWSDPDPDAGAAERIGRPTSMKDLTAFPRTAARPDPGSSGREPMDALDRAIAGDAPGPPVRRGAHPGAGGSIGPSVAASLAALLDALAGTLVAAVDAGGSLDDEPYRSALRLAAVIGDGTAS